MKYDYEKIIEALKIIKEVCEKSDCADAYCPFSKNETCCITDKLPDNWEIKDITELEKIKVFK